MNHYSQEDVLGWIDSAIKSIEGTKAYIEKALLSKEDEDKEQLHGEVNGLQFSLREIKAVREHFNN